MTASPAFGWTFLSRKDIQQAEAQLQPETEGVRDEIGFLAIHQAYADRFFPGTSVLQTRLRYALFVPWIFQQLAAAAVHEPAVRRLQEEERRLAGRLKAAKEDGVIGGRVYPNPASAPPSLVYWTALQTWKLLVPRLDGSSPSRIAALRSIDATRRHTRRTDDDQQALEPDRYLFVSTPAPPTTWERRDEPLSFRLSIEEQRFLRSRIGAVHRPDRDQEPSLLARLADVSVDLRPLEQPWLGSITALASAEDRAALARARQAAHLAAIGRAVYAALVEDWCARIDRKATPDLHRHHLEHIVAEHRHDAVRLDLNGVMADAVQLSVDPIVEVLRLTQRWLLSTEPFTTLADAYRAAEWRRKGLRRSRLGATVVNRERRSEWVADAYPLASPLHYRWPHVRRLLTDLRGGV